MRENGISGRPKRKKFERTDSNLYKTMDLVSRKFSRDGPNQFWMTASPNTRQPRAPCAAVRSSRLIQPFRPVDNAYGTAVIESFYS